MNLKNNSNIIVIKEDGTIARKLMYTHDLKNEIENLVKEGCCIEIYNPLTFGASEGDNRNHFDKEGIRYSNAELLEKCLLTLEDGKKIDEFDQIVDINELEKVKAYPKHDPTNKIETDDALSMKIEEMPNIHSNTEKWTGVEYLNNKSVSLDIETNYKQKTMEEKFKEKLITKEEYNEHIIEKRINLYSKLDGKQIEIMRLKNMNLITEEEYQTEILAIQKTIDEIKEKYKKA